MQVKPLSSKHFSLCRSVRAIIAAPRDPMQLSEASEPAVARFRARLVSTASGLHPAIGR
jgi:hypothetical protein